LVVTLYGGASVDNNLVISRSNTSSYVDHSPSQTTRFSPNIIAASDNMKALKNFGDMAN